MCYINDLNIISSDIDKLLNDINNSDIINSNIINILNIKNKYLYQDFLKL